MNIFKDSKEHIFVETSNCEGQLPSLNELSQIQQNIPDTTAQTHRPVVLQAGNAIQVNIEEVFPPTTTEHSTTTVFLETVKGGQYRTLSGSRSIAKFNVADDDSPKSVMAYCNPHGLWKHNF